mgnify:CR=1 FL=1
MRKGSKHRKETLLKISNAKVGQRPSNFKGDKARYETKHQWVYYHYGKATKCENERCLFKSPKIYHWANISGDYKRDIKDWIQLCPSCHKKMDFKYKSLCKNGHILEDNFLVDNRGSRICKTCKKINAHKQYLKNKEYIIEKVNLWRIKRKLVQ